MPLVTSSTSSIPRTRTSRCRVGCLRGAEARHHRRDRSKALQEPPGQRAGPTHAEVPQGGPTERGLPGAMGQDQAPHPLPCLLQNRRVDRTGAGPHRTIRSDQGAADRHDTRRGGHRRGGRVGRQADCQPLPRGRSGQGAAGHPGIPTKRNRAHPAHVGRDTEAIRPSRRIQDQPAGVHGGSGRENLPRYG